MARDRDALLLDVLDALLDVQAVADRLLARLQAREAGRLAESSGVFRVDGSGQRAAEIGHVGGRRST